MIESTRPSTAAMAVGFPHGEHHGVVEFVPKGSVNLFRAGYGLISNDEVVKQKFELTLLTFAEAMQRAEILAMEANVGVALPKDPFQMNTPPQRGEK